jgi:hypothetical protein
MADGHKTALEIALAAFEESRAETEESGAPQGDLFGAAIAAKHGAPPGTAVMPRGPGRPPGRETGAPTRLSIFTSSGITPGVTRST